MSKTYIDPIRSQHVEQMAIELHRPTWLAVALLLARRVDSDVVRRVYSSRSHSDNLNRLHLLSERRNPSRGKAQNRIVGVGCEVEHQQAHRTTQLCVAKIAISNSRAYEPT